MQSAGFVGIWRLCPLSPPEGAQDLLGAWADCNTCLPSAHQEALFKEEEANTSLPECLPVMVELDLSQTTRSESLTFVNLPDPVSLCLTDWVLSEDLKSWRVISVWNLPACTQLSLSLCPQPSACWLASGPSGFPTCWSDSPLSRYLSLSSENCKFPGPTVLD